MDTGESIGHWDTVIVGAGSSGCALANRLTASGNRRVLLIDAGSDFSASTWPREITHGGIFDIADYVMVFGGTYSETQPPVFVLRGRVVGGSSAVNGGMFLRGIAEDYDSWGSPLWSHQAVLPFFRAEERDLDFPESPIHGAHGPIPVRRPAPSEWLAYQSAFYEAVVGLGFPEKVDLADSVGDGVGAIPMNRVDNIRVSAAMGYLDPIRGRPNLTIRADTRVMKVVIDGGRARGVLGESGGRLVMAHADEVVLCTSGLMSPHVLVQSGIGPAATLTGLGLPVICDLPGVGKNVRDHPMVNVEVASPEGHATAPDDPMFQTMLVLSSESGSFRNDMHLFPMSWDEGTLRFEAVMQMAVSAGELEFEAGAAALPHVRYRYLEDGLDRSRFREVVRLVLELLQSPPLRELGARRLEPADEDLTSDAALDRWVDRSLGSAMHTSGTCRMGPDGDVDAVVDDEGRVRGIANLRVSDLSIAPNVVRAPANATAIMIGERMADLMLHGRSAGSQRA